MAFFYTTLVLAIRFEASGTPDKSFDDINCFRCSAAGNLEGFFFGEGRIIHLQAREECMVSLDSRVPTWDVAILGFWS